MDVGFTVGSPRGTLIGRGGVRPLSVAFGSGEVDRRTVSCAFCGEGIID